MNIHDGSEDSLLLTAAIRNVSIPVPWSGLLSMVLDPWAWLNSIGGGAIRCHPQLNWRLSRESWTWSGFQWGKLAWLGETLTPGGFEVTQQSFCTRLTLTSSSPRWTTSSLQAATCISGRSDTEGQNSVAAVSELHPRRHEAVQQGRHDVADYGRGFLRLQSHDHRRGHWLLALLQRDVPLQEPERQRDGPQERGGADPFGSVEDLLHRR